jgi:hypothetical protein
MRSSIASIAIAVVTLIWALPLTVELVYGEERSPEHQAKIDLAGRGGGDRENLKRPDSRRR